ncbi:hypothetical protein [Thiohalophilus thiocyanatoxydans]|uniref:O-acetyl-ADP-ribose deacetylase (Regulator of RNase III) n=1 Tax=Thiohalophilus thiocyanatoxydans TaxID=381308 RepID=A0A4R8IUG5_9GAMM|nr:hypothetical protein [Thiohalophilus thiocyanatoxydans]TDY00933.1 hypothetical protein EDC23_1678 [Thiohalophilus thiocyanatoxydans]
MTSDSFKPTLIRDREQPEWQVDGRALFIRPATHMPWQADVRVVEQDSWLVLGESSGLREDERPAWVQANQLESAPSYRPGSVIARAGQPPQLMMILYDLDQQPICQPHWVKQALSAVLDHAHDHDLSRLQIPLPGYQYGGLTAEAAFTLLLGELRAHRQKKPATILLALPDERLRQQLLSLLSEIEGC